jgi:acyl-CoA dehydrogenase
MRDGMDHTGEDLDAFRAEVLQFVRERLPHDLRETVRGGRQPSHAQLLRWHAELARVGWLVPHWAPEWGGQGWSARRLLAFDEVMCLNDAPELNAVTFDMIGPVLARYGTPAQQAAYLPAIASGRQWWCQGYSEPNAGSDLASLGTQARRDGDHYVVNGSKIWTSFAQYADWMFCLVRTDREAQPQQGISFLLIDMKTPGITVRPIVGIHGWVVFNEVFLDDVRVPAELLVGAENQGWTVAKSLLEFERLKLARVGENKRRMARARAAAMRRGADGTRVADQAWFRQRFAQLEMQLMALEANATLFVERSQAGERLGAEVSMLKLRGSRLIQLWEELTLDALGPEALVLDPAALVDGDGTPDWLAGTASSRRFLARGYTIAGGSSEIQHNILAKQVLGL